MREVTAVSTVSLRFERGGQERRRAAAATEPLWNRVRLAGLTRADPFGWSVWLAGADDWLRSKSAAGLKRASCSCHAPNGGGTVRVRSW